MVSQGSARIPMSRGPPIVVFNPLDRLVLLAAMSSPISCRGPTCTIASLLPLYAASPRACLHTITRSVYTRSCRQRHNDKPTKRQSVGRRQNTVAKKGGVQVLIRLERRARKHINLPGLMSFCYSDNAHSGIIFNPGRCYPVNSTELLTRLLRHRFLKRANSSHFDPRALYFHTQT